MCFCDLKPRAIGLNLQNYKIVFKYNLLYILFIVY